MQNKSFTFAVFVIKKTNYVLKIHKNNLLCIEIQILLIIIFFYFNYCSGFIETILFVSKQVSNNIDNTCLEIEF